MMENILERMFGLKAKQTTVRTELLAGLTTFVAMSYILFVVPQMLHSAGMPREAALMATICTTVAGTTLMGLWANLPVAVAPGMGLTAFFAYYVCGVQGLPWPTALGAVCISGMVFILLTVSRIRQMIIDAVPLSLKKAIVVGIGLFISFIGLQNAGIVVKDAATGVTLGNMLAPAPLLTCAGLLLTVALIARGLRGNMLIGILATTALGMLVGATPAPTGIGSFVSLNIPSLSATFLQLDFQGALHYGLVSIVFTFTMVELFDNIGTLIGLTRKAGLVDAEGRIENMDRALITDASATIFSSLVGSPTATSYIESAAGVAQGGRTGLTALTVAGLFALSIVFAPLMALVPSFATATALILVGALMMSEVTNIDFKDITEGFPAFMVILMMPLTYSIGNGFGFGFVSFVLIKCLAGRSKEIRPIMWIIALLFLVNFALRGQ